MAGLFYIDIKFITNLKAISIVGFMIFFWPLAMSQEICDNAIDDDADSLVDLNDPDCKCESLLPSSLIPNPSFEEMTCCPIENERLDCAVGWVQASAPTTDYVHTCGGYLGNTSIPAFAPLPFPDGEGGVGFRDGQMHAGSNYKEYVGACLTQKMKSGTNYKLDFFVGFRNNVQGSQNLKIAVFGSPDCNQLPFGGNDNDIGCPANTGLYNLIGESSVSGSGEWINVTIEFVAQQDYEVIVLGPACAPHPDFRLDPYFYLDRLTLAESTAFGIPLEQITGRICDHNLMLYIESNPGYTYQWYKDGIALEGETHPVLHLSSDTDGEGVYSAVVTTQEGCFNTQGFQLSIPPYPGFEEVRICEGENYSLGGQIFDQPGHYEVLIQAEDGCDSLVQLNLEVNEHSDFTLNDTICEGDIYHLHGIEASQQGVYETTISNDRGCDSVITLNLNIVGAGLGIDIQRVIVVELGEPIKIEPAFCDPRLVSFIWSTELGHVLSSGKALENFIPINDMLLLFDAYDMFGCRLRKTVEIRIESEYRIYIPNAFSPNGDGINDTFQYYPSRGVEFIDAFIIYDRWGNLVFEIYNLDLDDQVTGWDGTSNGVPLENGVYTYMVSARFLDGYVKIFRGDLTLMK